VLPFVFLVAFVFRARIQDAYRDIRVRLARINAYLHERITGVRVVQLFNREHADAQRHEEINRDYLEAHLRSITYYALFFPMIELLTAVALALIVWYGGGEILQGTVTVGVVAAFLQYARRFFRPIQDLSEKYNLLQAAMASSERVFRLLDREEELNDPATPATLPAATRGEIEFRDVWFAYGQLENGEPDWVIKGLSFRAAPGETIAIVLRMHDLRARIGLVLQDVFLFSEDVRYNIRLGAPIAEERLSEAARRVGADRLVARLPRGYAQPLTRRSWCSTRPPARWTPRWRLK
jgi:ATP-binding cassette subfamily B protein